MCHGTLIVSLPSSLVGELVMGDNSGQNRREGFDSLQAHFSPGVLKTRHKG